MTFSVGTHVRLNLRPGTFWGWGKGDRLTVILHDYPGVVVRHEPGEEPVIRWRVEHRPRPYR